MRAKRKNEQFTEELENLIEKYKQNDEMSMHRFTDRLKKTKHRYAATESAVEERQKIAKIGKKLCDHASQLKEEAKEEEEKLEEKYDVELVEVLEEGLTVKYEGEKFMSGHEGCYITGPEGEELDLDKEHPVKRFVSERFDLWQRVHSDVVEVLESMDKVRSVFSNERGFSIQLERSHYEIRTHTFYPNDLEDIRVVFDHHDNMGNITEILLDEDLEEALQNSRTKSEKGENQ